MIWNHFKIIYLLRLSFLLFYDTWINFMINTLTGNSWSMFIFFYNNHLIHRWRIVYILFYTLLCWWFVLEFFFTFFFRIYTHLEIWKRLLSLLKIVGYLFVIWSQQPDSKKEFYNNISNTMDMQSDIKVQNQLLLNILPRYSTCNFQ